MKRRRWYEAQLPKINKCLREFDYYILGEQERSYGGLFLRDKIVLDVGGHVGLFALFALSKGAKRVISIEPFGENYKIMRKLSSSRSHLKINAAVVAGDEKKTTLYVNPGKNTGLHSTVPTRGREGVVVAAVNVENLIYRYRPEVVKMDVEGGEYDLIAAVDFRGISQVAVELHLTKREWRDKLYPVAICKLRKIFKEVIIDAKNTGKNWTTLFVGKK